MLTIQFIVAFLAFLMQMTKLLNDKNSNLTNSGFRLTLYLHEKIENQTAFQDKEVWVLNSFYNRVLQSSYLVDLWLLKLQIALSL